MSNEIKKNLLPSGFYDLMPDNAFNELETNLNIIKILRSSGYSFVRPSIMEFEQSLDKNASSEFFKVTDSLSGKMMVLRNDITPQIARIVKDRFEIEKVKQLKISYSGQIFRKSGKGKFAERQITQTGLELIGNSKPEGDAEVLTVISKIFSERKIKNYTIDFCIPNLAQKILGEIDKLELNKILKKIESKNIQDFKASKKTKILSDIISLCDEVSNSKEAAKIKDKLAKILPKKIQEVTNPLFEIIKILEKKIGVFKLSLNILETKNFYYHTGVCYSVISDETYEELARGGRYEIKIKKDKYIPAVGATIILNALLRVGLVV